MAEDNNSLSYCAALVRKHDRGRFVTALFADGALREGLLALYAYNHEIARTREVVTETMIGQMRLQFWRDAIRDIYETNTAPEHEVATALHEAVRKHNLQRELLEQMIYAREFDLEDVTPADMKGLEIYARETTAPLFRLGLACLGVTDEAVLAAADEAASAYALTGLLRAVPFHAGQGRCYLPADVMKARGVSQDRLFAGDVDDGLKQVVEKIAAVAEQHLNAAREMCPKPPKAAMAILLNATLAGQYLALLRKCGYNCFDPRMQTGPAFSELRLWWRARTGCI